MRNLKNRHQLVASFGEEFVALLERGKIPAGGAGTALTDALAAGAAVIDADQSGMPLGQDVRQLFQNLVDKIRDAAFVANEINRRIPSGAAKTALATVITDLT